QLSRYRKQGRVSRRSRHPRPRRRDRSRLLQLGPSAPQEHRVDWRGPREGALMSGFEGKTVVITGAAGGIGLCLAHWFGSRGAHIVGLDKSVTSGVAASTLEDAGITARFMRLDIGDAEAVEAAFGEIERVDVMINNAGYSQHHVLRLTNPESWAEEINGNLNGAFYCAHASA